MATYNWPSGLDDVIVYGSPIREPGLLGWYHFNNVPDMPDSAAGTTYNGVFTTVDGWATMGADTVVTAASGELVLTSGSSPATFVRANKALDVSTKTVRIKWRCAQTDLTTIKISSSSNSASHPLSQTTRNWRGMCAAPNGNIYAVVVGGDIYMQTAGTGNFVALSQAAREWYGMCAAPNGNIYVSVAGGDIYMQTAGTGNFVALAQAAREWRGMCAASNGNIYVSVAGGDIYMQTAGDGNFVALAQTTRSWVGMCAAPNGNIYAADYGGDIYMQTAGDGNFVALAQTTRSWVGMCAAPNGNIYASVAGGDMYMQTAGDGNFVALSQTARSRVGICAAPNGNIYASVYGGDIYCSAVMKSILGSVSGMVDAYSGTGFTDFELTFNTSSTNVTPVYIEAIYVGTGAYSAGSAVDYSGNATHGTINGCIPVDGPNGGKALSFDAVNDYVLLDKTDFPTTGAFTLCGWVQGKTSRGAVQVIVSRYAASGNRGFYTSIGTNNLFGFAVSADGTNAVALNAPTGTEITDDAFFACVFDPGIGMYIYKNGVLVASNVTTSPTAVYYSATQVMTLGSNYTYTENLDGWLSEVRLYARSLSPMEIAYLYANPTPYVALPSAPLQNGYQETKETCLVRTNMEVGPVKTRRRYTAVPRYYELQYQLSWNQKQILEDFHDRLCAYGSLPFNWTNPLTGELTEARFMEPPSFAASSQEFLATVRQEVLP